MSTLDDTDGLRLFMAQEFDRIKHDPRRPGALDTMLLSITIGSAAVVIISLVILTFAADHFPIEPGRIVLTMAAAGTCVSPVLLGMYGVNRINRRRFDALMEKVDAKAEKIGEESAALIGGLVRAIERQQAGAEQMPIAEVHELAKDVYRLARRQRTADDS